MTFAKNNTCSFDALFLFKKRLSTHEIKAYPLAFHSRNALLLLFISCIAISINAQPVSILKSVSNPTPNMETSFDFILDYQCTSVVNDCENVVITDALPKEVHFLGLSVPSGANGTYDAATNTVTITFTGGVIQLTFLLLMLGLIRVLPAQPKPTGILLGKMSI